MDGENHGSFEHSADDAINNNEVLKFNQSRATITGSEIFDPNIPKSSVGE